MTMLRRTAGSTDESTTADREADAPDAECCNVGVPDDRVPVHVGQLTNARASVSGFAAGTPPDAEDALAFSARRDVTPTVERYAPADAQAAYDAMTATDVRYRAVLEP